MIVCLKCGEVLHPNLFNAYRRELGIRKRKNYYNDFICYNCHDSYMMNVDDGIANSIVKLNKKGFKTQYCCEGHNGSYGGYVYFTEDIDVRNFPSLPLGWKTDYDLFNRLKINMDVANCNTIRYDLTLVNDENKDYVISEAIKSFNKWVDELCK